MFDMFALPHLSKECCRAMLQYQSKGLRGVYGSTILSVFNDLDRHTYRTLTAGTFRDKKRRSPKLEQWIFSYHLHKQGERKPVFT
jgi:hypothetical protein